MKRDIIDYDELADLKSGEIKDLQKRLGDKLNEIEKQPEPEPVKKESPFNFFNC